MVLKFWPLLHSHAVPDQPVAGNVAATSHREGIVRAFAEDHPVVAMSRNPDEWMHKPFDVAELAHNFGDPLEVYVGGKFAASYHTCSSGLYVSNRLSSKESKRSTPPPILVAPPMVAIR